MLNTNKPASQLPPNKKPCSAFDGYVRRLLQSANPVERESLYFGYTLHHQYPVLPPLDLLFEHVHILGAPGTGKSALGVAPLTAQLIRRNDGPVIVLDLKGDMALFNTARIEAEEAGRTFKWFTNKPYRSTYIFNPWRQSYLERLILPEILGLFLLSLNMNHGDDYGRAFFGLKSRALLQEALKHGLDLENSPLRSRNRHSTTVPQSFVELETMLQKLARNSQEQRAGEHLVNVLQSLVDFPQLNMAPNQPASSQAVQHAIHMPDVIRGKQVVYFWLQALMDVTTVAEIARLVLYAALSAAVGYRDETGAKPRVYLIVDEAQILVAQNIANVLAQAREYGLACVLAHQSMSQLNPPGGVDLRELVMNCTGIKQFWSARDPEQKDYISKISGEVGYYSASWDQFKYRVSRGLIGRGYAAAHRDEPMYISISESVGPRLSSQDIEDYSRQPNTNILTIERNAGLSHFQGAFPVHMDWIMSADEFRRRNFDMSWPEDTEETITTTGVWPKIDGVSGEDTPQADLSEGLPGEPSDSTSDDNSRREKDPSQDAAGKLDKIQQDLERKRKRDQKR